MKPACILILLFLIASACAQSPAIPKPEAQQTATASTPAPTAYTLPPDKMAKSEALHTLRLRQLIIGTIWAFLIPLGLLYSGTSARFRDWAEKVSRVRFVQALIFVPLVMLTMAALEIPLSIWQQNVSLRFGLSVQSWGSWFLDVLKGEFVMLPVWTVLLWLLFALIRKSPQRWWFYAWIIAMPLTALAIFLIPIVIDPIFNNFTPLESHQPGLVEAIEKVTQRGGLSIPRSHMYEMDAARRYTTINAYVTGIGASKRVVVWDTTIRKMTREETLFVFGHEMGHYVLNHIYKGMVVGAVLSHIGLYLLFRICGWILPRFQNTWKVRGPDDWAVLPALFLIAGLLQFLGQPLGVGFGRYVEHQADIYGLEVTHGINKNSQEAAARAFQTLGEDSLSYPNPEGWLVFWYYDHPPNGERLRFAREYDPWAKGEAPEFVK